MISNWVKNMNLTRLEKCWNKSSDYYEVGSSGQGGEVYVWDNPGEANELGEERVSAHEVFRNFKYTLYPVLKVGMLGRRTQMLPNNVVFLIDMSRFTCIRKQITLTCFPHRS